MVSFYMNYFEEREIKAKAVLERTLNDMPPFCRLYFLGNELNLAIKTLENASYYIRMFFNYLSEQFKKPAKHFTLTDLNALTTDDIRKFLSHCAEKSNSATVGEKIYTLNVFFRYFYRNGDIDHNPVDRIVAPKRKEKPIIRLEQLEIEKVLNSVNNDFRKRKLPERFLLRDKTILVLFLSSGIRVSELVGLDIGDVDMTNDCFQVTRKGGNQEMIYMTPELKEQLEVYIKQLSIIAKSEPLFKNYLGNRMHKKSVQDVVKKYCKNAKIEKHITPHKLRSTFGTQLYRNTRDIYLVAKVLGHADVETTTKHYAATDEDIKRNAMLGFSIT